MDKFYINCLVVMVLSLFVAGLGFDLGKAYLYVPGCGVPVILFYVMMFRAISKREGGISG